MENQSPSSLANSAISRRSDASDERDLEIAKLKERLGFYESFDQIIQENVARAGDLLRHAVSVRENADEAVNSATRELEQKRLSERQEQRALLSGLLDDVTTMQVHVERLARKVADALDDIEATLPAGPDLDFLPGSNDAPIAALVAPVDESLPDLALDPTPEEIGPEDLSTIAARVAEEHSPLAVETAAVAAETSGASDQFPNELLADEAVVAPAESSADEFESKEVPFLFEEAIDVGSVDIAAGSAAESEETATSEEVEGYGASTQPEDAEIADLADFVVSESDEQIGEDLPQTTTESFGEENSADFLPELELSADDETELPLSLVEEPEIPFNSGIEAIPTEDLSDPVVAFRDEPAAIDTLDVEPEHASPSLEPAFNFAESVAIASDEAIDVPEAPEVTGLEESPHDLPYVATLPGNIRSLSTDELFLAPELSSTEDETGSESAQSSESDAQQEELDAEEPVSDSEFMEATDEIPGDDGVLSSDANVNDVADADAVIEAIESSAYQAAAPAALAEDPVIDAALSESVQHLSEEAETEAVAPVEQEAEIETAPEAAPEVAEESPTAAATPDVRPFPAGGLGNAPRPSTAELRNAALARFTAPSAPSGVRGIGTVVLVHGVPRATTALSLKRYLESLPHVSSVEPREYAEGILRLHVTADRSIHIDDLRGWSDGMGFEPVHLRDDLVEVRLPH